jgi:NAD(P)-dependent dehydrogenase (short-subunit alcohol dehydrogenase family)
LETAAERCGEARVVNHSSLLRIGKPLEEKYMSLVDMKTGGLGGDHLNARNDRYQQTKLANAVFTYAMADKLNAKPGCKVKALVAHPGIAKTQLVVGSVKDGAMPQWMISAFMAVKSMAGDDGACGIMSCMCLPEASNGDFWGPGKTGVANKGPAIKFKPAPKDLTCMSSEETKSQLWQWSEKAVGVSFAI